MTTPTVTDHLQPALLLFLLVGLGGGRDGLNGYKANLSPGKLKLADIGLELSMAKFWHLEVPIDITSH